MKKHLFLTGVGIALILGSCTSGDAVNAASQILGGASHAPVFLNCRAAAADEVEFEFSLPVKVTSINFEPAIEVDSIEDGSTIRVKLKSSPEPGKLITADLLAEDEKRNTINVLVSFRSRNNRMPQLVINEFRTEYSNPRVEFIEFKLKTSGNLGGMRVFMAGGSQKPSMYEFAPVEVKAGDYVVLHCRKREDDCIDEYGSNLAESGGTGNCPTARDFWIPGTVKLINKTAGYIYVLDQDDKVLSAVMFSEKDDAWWSKDYLAEAAEFLFNKDAWSRPGGGVCTPADAIKTTGTTATRTISRDESKENTNTSADWYITATSGATPGTLNEVKRYVP